ncbi:hypothetical protein B0H16DRAFT_1335341 [Mycena metata]|uniref:BTB domain-containing protein n=1 Tax=Mycena metata TaxID=1033252 RepID=A0AAD7HJH8_9AGAR|nr:hypothetical protein B0H16DRAFT_1335341 [Mycena metata]
MDWDDGSVYGENLYHSKPWLNLAKHPRFYHADGNLTVIIGDMQYKLHRYLFKKCSWFFQSNGEPTYLLGFTHKDFDHFLSILYPQDYSEEECKTAEEWTSVLTVAVDAGMQDVRRLAIKRLTSLASPVDKIALGHRYNIKEWLGPAYLALAMRKEPISSLEGAKIGIEALVRVAALKDEVFANLTSYVDQNKFSELFASKLAL